jgi:hypothetical protein
MAFRILGTRRIKNKNIMYYPKSQIKNNLYTNGDEYILSTNQQSYKGYYYKTSNGDKYTGKFPNDGSNILLVELTPSSDEPGENNPILTLAISQYNTNIQPERFLPLPTQTLPTQKDKDLGSFPRYFCKKNNENLYIEINKEQFTKLQNRDKTIAWDLYTPLQIIWQIKGDKTQTSNANKTNITLIEQRNKWYGFTKYFKDNFLKYYLES